MCKTGRASRSPESENPIMTKRTYMHYRWARRLALLLAAAPLFQLSQCSTGIRQVSNDMLQAMPSTIFGIVQGFLLLPLQLIFAGGA